MNVYARFDEIPSMTLKDIKETIFYGFGGHMHRQHENSIYPPTNTVCRVKNIHVMHCMQY